MSFEKRKKAGGRQKGTPNKVTRTVKETVLAVFNKLQEEPGPEEKDVRLHIWAQREPTEFYRIASKLIPTEVTGKLKNIIIVKSSDDEDDDEQPALL